MITLYNEKNEKLKLISVFEFNDADMGESSISATVSFSEEQDFHPDWYVVYNGEKFYLGVRKPTGKKDTSSLSTTYTLVFKSEREDLKRYTFMDFVELGSGNPQPSSYNVPLYATLSEFVDRFNLNLRHYMGDRWRMVLPQDYTEDGNAISISFDNATLWDVLIKVYEMYGVRWVIRSAGNVLQIQVGFQEIEIEHVFEYGKDNGLVSVERNNPLERIITRLRGRGSEKNLPPDYFHAGDPDTNSSLQAVFFKNLMPKVYRDYVRGYNAGSGSGTWAYNQGVSDKAAGRHIAPIDYALSDKEDLWGISYGAIEPNEKIFPTLQGATRNGVRLDEVLAVEKVLVDGVKEPQNTIAIGIDAAGQESSSGKCGNSPKNNYLEDCRGGIEFTIFTDRFQVTNPINTAQIRITMSPSYIGDDGFPVPVEFGATSTVRSSAELQLVDFANSVTGEVVRTQTISDTDSYLWELDDIPSGDYRFKANVVWSANIQRAEYDPTASDVVVNVDTRLTGATVKEYARATDKGEWKETFDIEIRDVWGIARNADESDEDYTYRVWEPRAVSEDMTVMFSDGLLAGEDYEFRIVGFSSDSDNLYQVITTAIKPIEGGWRLTLQKSEAELEASNTYLPNTQQNAKPGDHFFFINISMPYDPYVYDAEARLNAYLEEQLAMKDEEFPSFTITPSKIFCSSFGEVDKIKAGAKIRVRNVALIGDSYISLYIQSLTKRYNANSLNPEWNLTLSDLVVASGNPVEVLEGQVNVLTQRVYSNRSAVQEAVRSLSSTFVRKDGIADVSYSPTEFKKNIKLGEGIADKGFRAGDIQGQGFGVYTDDDGNRVIEADVLVGRIGARFNEVVINQVSYSAGKQVFSAAGMVVSRVEDAGTSWRCYFDTKNGTVRNYFAVNDGAFSQRFTDAGIRQYWARVTAIGADYIDISKTDRMQGSFDPVVGDNIAQLGNSADKSRQAALMIDETHDGGGLVTWYDDITDFTLSNKDSVNIGRVGGKTWLQVYGAGYIGDREQTQYIKYENGVLQVKGRLEVGTKLSDGRDLEQAINEATPEGYEEFVEQVTKEFENIRNEMDGAIDTWFGEEVPTLNNYPASDWVTDTDKDSHLGDLFYTNDGKAFRFQYTLADGYYWAVIEDSEVVKALELAQKALDTADGKRRVFIDTPYPPYDLGDLWAGGENSPLKRCVKAKGENGSYAASDWALADDSHAYSDAVKAELEESILTTKTALDKSISDTKAASEKYTDDAKIAIQDTISELEKAKANIDDVYSKAEADKQITRAEQDAIDAAQKAADAAIALADEKTRAYADGIVTEEEKARIEQAEKNLKEAKKYAEDKAKEAFEDASDLIAGYDYLRRALGESTITEGGLIQSSLLMLGYTENGVFNVMSGTNGLYDATKKGGGIAAWYGGPMADIEADNTLAKYAQSLFRFDGSGYLAGGNITWDKDGAGSVAGGDISWDKDGVITLGGAIKISGDVDATLGSILEYVNELRKLWSYDEENKAVHTTLNLIVDGGGAFGKGSGGGGDVPSGGGIDETQLWNILGASGTQTIHSSHIPDLSGKYLPLSGGTISNNSAITPLVINSNATTYAVAMRIECKSANKVEMGWDSSIGTYLYSFASSSYLSIKDDGTPVYNTNTLIHSGNIGSYNAGSATKLQTARTIWGQSFDGSAAVNGCLHITEDNVNSYTQGIRINQVSVSNVASIWLATVNSYGYDAGMWGISASNSGSLRFRGGVTSASDLMQITQDGNVLIGTTDDNGYKLDVNGTLNATTIYQNGVTLDSKLAGYLPLSGGTLTGPLTLSSGTDAAYDKTALSFIRTLNSVEQARIGTDSSGGIGVYSVGNIYLRGNVTLGERSTNGVVIYKDWLSFNANAIIHEGNYSTTTDNRYLKLSGGTVKDGTSREALFLDTDGTIGTTLSFRTKGVNTSLIGHNSAAAFGVFITNIQSDKALMLGNDGKLWYCNSASSIPRTWEVLHTGNYSTTVDNRYLQLTGGTITGNLNITSGNIGIYDNAGNGILAPLSASNTWTGVSGEAVVAVGSSAHKTVIRTNADNLYHYNLSAGKQYKIYDSGNLTKEALGVYARTATVNGTSWNIAGTTNTPTTFDIYAPITKGSSGQFLRSSGTGAPIWETISWYDASVSRTANTVLAAPNGGNGAATFRALVAADIPTVNTVLCQAGTDNINRPIVLTNKSNSLWYAPKALVNYATGDLTLYSESGDSPALIFQRGAIDDYTTTFDWKTFVSGGDWYLQHNYGGWTTAFKIDYYGTGTIKSLNVSNGLVLNNASSSAFNDVGILFGSSHLARIGLSSAGGLGIYAAEGIYLRPNSGSANAGIGVVIAQSGDVTMSHTLTVSSNIHTNGDIILNDTTGTSSISRKLKFLRRTESDDYWDYGLYAQTTKGLTFYRSANGVNTDIAYIDGNGNLVATGGGAFGSDIRYKDITSYKQIDLETIVNAPLFTFKWTDRDDKEQHLGTSAQYWLDTQFKDAVNTTNKDFYHLDYGALAVGIGISVAREVKGVKTEVQLLREKVNQLEQELAQYRRA